MTKPHLIGPSSRATLINSIDKLQHLKTDYADDELIDAIAKAVVHVNKHSEDAFSKGNPLIRDTTADTLIAIHSVVIALHMAFQALSEWTIFDTRERRAFTGGCYLLDSVEEALEFEIGKRGGSDE